MNKSLKDLNLQRKEDFFKDPETEDFLDKMNRILFEVERRTYQNLDIQYPLLFIFGLPRSGTTLISQVLSSTFDIGYIDNIAARFYLAPLHGIRLSKAVITQDRQSDFMSNYATTNNISDIHEFGYFWRYWLKKDMIEDIIRSREIENEIDWPGLRNVLSNMQKLFDKPMVFKNIFGAYHLQRLKKELSKINYIYIERDELDVASSILGARLKFNTNINAWWSTIPLEYKKLKSMNHMEQIAGQVFHLNQFYQNNMKNLDAPLIKVDYQRLCQNPHSIIHEIQEFCRKEFDYELTIKRALPKSFPFRTYEHEEDIRLQFKRFFEKFRKNQV